MLPVLLQWPEHVDRPGMLGIGLVQPRGAFGATEFGKGEPSSTLMCIDRLEGDAGAASAPVSRLRLLAVIGVPAPAGALRNSLLRPKLLLLRDRASATAETRSSTVGMSSRCWRRRWRRRQRSSTDRVVREPSGAAYCERVGSPAGNSSSMLRADVPRKRRRRRRRRSSAAASASAPAASHSSSKSPAPVGGTSEVLTRSDNGCELRCPSRVAVLIASRAACMSTVAA
mmetsp:Transcript_14429/g.43648  ORF Transcript_14429/g.43648 Transcript_14429/m.43648 type:complete len:228 (-) Transcript_14429:1532-2215(-)